RRESPTWTSNSTPAATSSWSTSTSSASPIPRVERAISSRVRVGLSTKIFFATAIVVIVVLGGALLITARRASQAADDSIDKALAATRSAIEDALRSRSTTLVHASAVLARVPQYV